MKKLLFINACIRGEKSRTMGLCRLYIDKFLDAQNLLGEVFAVEEVNLEREFVSGKLVPQTAGVLNTREPLVTEQRWEDPMFSYARQFVEADYIVIGAPFWDLNFPAVLRIYLERISVPDLTYVYDEQGIPHGKSRIQGGAYIMTAGGPTEGMNYGYEYINGLFKNLFTLPELKLYKAEMIDVYGVNSEAVLEETRKQIIGDLEQEADSLKAAEEKKKKELLKQEALKKPFVCINYKGVKPDNPRGSKEALTERILDKIIEMNEFVIPDELNDEIEYIYKGNIQSLRYQNMFGAGKPADEGEVKFDAPKDWALLYGGTIKTTVSEDVRDNVTEKNDTIVEENAGDITEEKDSEGAEEKTETIDDENNEPETDVTVIPPQNNAPDILPIIHILPSASDSIGSIINKTEKTVKKEIAVDEIPTTKISVPEIKEPEIILSQPAPKTKPTVATRVLDNQPKTGLDSSYYLYLTLTIVSVCAFFLLASILLRALSKKTKSIKWLK